MADVADVAAAVRYLAAEGLADAARAVIDGGSAGGFTTLAALAFTDAFAAGTSLYGVADCSLLAQVSRRRKGGWGEESRRGAAFLLTLPFCLSSMQDTHKFEVRAVAGLEGGAAGWGRLIAPPPETGAILIAAPTFSPLSPSQSRYLDSLIGPYPAAKATYDARSPINAVDRIDGALLLLQGDEDRIVPPNQATGIYDALKARGVPTALIMYEGEQHG